jgi:hypothetical protein
LFSSNHLHRRPLESALARLRRSKSRPLTHRLHRHMQTTPDPLEAERFPSGRGAIPNYVFCCGNAFNEEGCHCHLAFHVSQVSGPVLAMFDRATGLSPPTVLLFGESFLNSSLDDRILSLLLEVGQDLSSILVVAEPETRLVVIYPVLAHVVSCAECLKQEFAG